MDIDVTKPIYVKKLKSNESHWLNEQSSNQFLLIQNFQSRSYSALYCKYSMSCKNSVIILNLVRKAEYKVHSPFLFKR